MDHGVETIGLVLHPRKPVGESITTIVRWAEAAGQPVLALDQDRDRVPPEVEVVSDDEFRRRVAGVVSLGGDGTMLGAMRLVADRPVPVLGVNHGNLGFLVEVTPSGLEAALARLADGDFTVEQHGCLVAETSGPDELSTGYGFNDVVLARLGRTGAVSIDLAVNDLRYGYYKCDAVVLATPNGSTAYNYAAGGPILSPSAACTVIAPVAPMAGIGRAVVLGAGDVVSLTVAEDSAPVAVDVDGTAAGELKPGDVLTARMRVDAAEVVRLDASAHAGRSRVKLSLLDLPLRRDQLLELIPAELRQEAAELNARRSGAEGPLG
ncbi:NAD(+)/NADH kinase [Actinoplanes sp. NPDC049265]|uniref:NAD(+)/NADH kinase n=1 Tax=Actinoplanes sp. NPDC049265 TaxID=3363902 RepID=UPI0037182560